MPTANYGPNQDYLHEIPDLRKRRFLIERRVHGSVEERGHIAIDEIGHPVELMRRAAYRDGKDIY